MHPVPSEAEAARPRIQRRRGLYCPGTPGAPGAAAAASRRLPPATAPGAARMVNLPDSSGISWAAVREQETVARLEETRQTFTIIREKFSLRSRKQ